jgi:excisionase family DNA binding protein
MSKYLRIPVAAERLGVSKSTLYHWISARSIPHVKIGQTVLFREDELEAWVEAHRVGTLAGTATQPRGRS